MNDDCNQEWSDTPENITGSTDTSAQRHGESAIAPQSAGQAPTKLPPGRRTRPAKGDARFGRTAVGNGTTLLPGVSGRSLWARRAKEVISDIVSDLGGADDDRCCADISETGAHHDAVATANSSQKELIFFSPAMGLPPRSTA
jgi:hypothetical protein